MLKWRKNDIMFNLRYKLVEITSTKDNQPKHEDFLGKICYPAYFKVGEEGWFLCETDGCTYAPDRIRTSEVKNVQFFRNNSFVVFTNNSKYVFEAIVS